MKARAIVELSRRIVIVERAVCAWLVAVVVGLILLNVLTRMLGMALYWVDELAVYTMIWMALIGTSLLLQERRHVAVTLVLGQVGEHYRRLLVRTVNILILLFSIGLFLMCIAWYDPYDLLKHGFDSQLFAESTYNFVYQEPTNTLGIRKFWVWLVVSVVSITMIIHALANLVSEGTRVEQK